MSLRILGNRESEDELLIMLQPYVTDTSEAAEAVRVERLRNLTPQRKLQLLESACAGALQIGMAGLRLRHPQADETELHRRMAYQLLGSELARHVLDWKITSMNAGVVEVIDRVVSALDKLSIPYYIGGSVASSVHGDVRQTRDVDIVADLPLEKAEAFVAELGGDFYVDVDAVKETVRSQRSDASFNLIHNATVFKVDVFVLGPRPFEQSEFSRRVAVRLLPGAAKTYVKSPEDVVLRKLLWYRQGGEVSERQLRDAAGVISIQGDKLDRAYLERWAAELGVLDLLHKLE